jgi:flagellar motor switch protein FliN/FliY
MADDPEQLGQDDIEKLLQQAQQADPPADVPAEPPAAEPVGLGQDEIEAMLNDPSSAAAPPPQETVTEAVGQADIEAMFGNPSPPAAAASSQPPPPASKQRDTADERVAEEDLELLLDHAQQAIASVDQPLGPAPADGAVPFRLSDFSGAPPSAEGATLELIRDVELDVRIELGRANMHLEEVLKLHKGSVVPLDKLAGDPVDVYVNGRLIARGEVLVLNDNFCVRIAELIVGESAVA